MKAERIPIPAFLFRICRHRFRRFLKGIPLQKDEKEKLETGKKSGKPFRVFSGFPFPFRGSLFLFDTMFRQGKT